MTIDPYFFLQTGLDSGALTMLGVVVHQLEEPGEYRGSVSGGDGPQAEFFVTADPDSAVAQATIDLATVGRERGEKCEQRVTVHPKGYVVLRVSGGTGGHRVHLRRNDEDRERRAYDTAELQPGDTFSGVVLRPGRYSMANVLSGARGELTVRYPEVGKEAFRPPAPVEAEVGESISPERIELWPTQGINFHVVAPARVRIELLEPDDGPGPRATRRRAGWRKPDLGTG